MVNSKCEALFVGVKCSSRQTQVEGGMLAGRRARAPTPDEHADRANLAATRRPRYQCLHLHAHSLCRRLPTLDLELIVTTCLLTTGVSTSP